MQRNKKRKEKKLECRQIGGLRSIWWSANIHVVVCLCVAANCCWINCKSFIIWLVKAKWSYKPFKRVQSIPPKWWRSLFDFVSDDFNSFSHWMMRKFRQIMENHTQNNTIVFCYICVCWLNHWLRSNRLRYVLLLHTHTHNTFEWKTTCTLTPNNNKLNENAPFYLFSHAFDLYPFILDKQQRHRAVIH